MHFIGSLFPIHHSQIMFIYKYCQWKELFVKVQAQTAYLQNRDRLVFVHVWNSNVSIFVLTCSP